MCQITKPVLLKRVLLEASREVTLQHIEGETE